MNTQSIAETPSCSPHPLESLFFGVQTQKIVSQKIENILKSPSKLEDYYQYILDNIPYLKTIGIDISIDEKKVFFTSAFQKPQIMAVFGGNASSKLKKISSLLSQTPRTTPIIKTTESKEIFKDFFEYLGFQVFDSKDQNTTKFLRFPIPEELSYYGEYIKKKSKELESFGVEIDFQTKKVTLLNIPVPIASYEIFGNNAVISLKELAQALKLKNITQVGLKDEAIYVLSAFFRKIGFQVQK